MLKTKVYSFVKYFTIAFIVATTENRKGKSTVDNYPYTMCGYVSCYILPKFEVNINFYYNP